MRLPYWLHNLLHPNEVPRLDANPYSTYDNSLSSKYFMWELYREPISNTEDKRTYLFSAVKHLREHGKLVEEYAPAIEKAASTETAFAGSFTVSTMRRVLDVLANGPRGEFRGKA